MITLENQGTAFIGQGSGVELGFTQPGTYHLEGVTYVAGGTNAQISLTSLRDGAIVIVDAGNNVKIIDGADIPAYLSYGFGTAIMTVGIILVIRNLIGRFGRAAGIGLES